MKKQKEDQNQLKRAKMRKHFIRGKGLCAAFLLMFVLLAGSMPLDPDPAQQEQNIQNQIDKAKIYQDVYPLISESDLYCSLYVLEEGAPEIRVIEAERSDEKILMSDADVVYIDKGKSNGLEVGQLFLIVEVGRPVKNPLTGETHGFLAFKRGRARLIYLEESRGVAKLEKSCGQVMLGSFLLPFEEREGLLGKDMGFEAYSAEGEGIKGHIIYLEREYNQIGTGHWAIIDVGSDDGVQVGQQMTIYRRIRKDLPRQAVGNLIVIDAQKGTSTIKVLSCSDSIEPGFQVQSK